MQYSLPYILLILFFLGVAAFQLGISLEENSRRYINFFIISTYVLFFGFRGFIATDWVNYYNLFKYLPSNIFLALENHDSEPGFILYSVVIKQFFKRYETYQLINTLTNVFLLHFFFKKYLPSKYYALGFAVFLVFNGSIFELNLLRNFKGLLIFLMALPYIEERKPFKYFALVLLAFLFHWSSIVFFPLYFFLHKKIPMKIFLITFVVGSLIYFLKIEYITPIIKFLAALLPIEMAQKIFGYMDSSVYSRSYGFTFGYFERTLTTFLILFYYNKIQTNRTNILFVNSFFVYINLFLYFSEVSIVLNRVAGNFAYSYWILIPIIIQKTERNLKPLLTVFFALLLIAKMYLITNSIIYDYDSFLYGQSKTYDQRLEIFHKNQKIVNGK